MRNVYVMMLGLLFFVSFPTFASQLPADVPYWTQGIPFPERLVCDGGVTKVTIYYGLQENEPRSGSASTVSINNVTRLYYFYSVSSKTRYTFLVKNDGTLEKIGDDAWYEKLQPYGGYNLYAKSMGLENDCVEIKE